MVKVSKETLEQLCWFIVGVVVGIEFAIISLVI